MHWWLIALLGLGVGILVGATGTGGGSLMTPLLILLFNTAPTVAIGTDLMYAAVTRTLGGVRHLRKQTVDMTLVRWLAFGSIPGALGGVYVLRRLEHALGKHTFDDLVLGLVAGALLVTSVAVLGRVVFRNINERQTVDPFRLRHKVAAVSLGLFVGFVLGLTSAGAGSLIAVGLLMVYRLAPRRVVGTDLLHAAILCWVAAVAQAISGNVDFGLALNILVGSIPGVWLGSSLSLRAPEGALRPTLGIVLLAAGLALLQKSGTTFPTYLIFVAPAIVGAAVFALHLFRSRLAAVQPATPVTQLP
jgi:uncharacterized membrane protein YfcA